MLSLANGGLAIVAEDLSHGGGYASRGAMLVADGRGLERVGTRLIPGYSTEEGSDGLGCGLDLRLGFGSFGMLLEVSGATADGFEPPAEAFGQGIVDIGGQLACTIGKDGTCEGGTGNDDKGVVGDVVEGVEGLGGRIDLSAVASGTTHGMEFDRLTGLLAKELTSDGLSLVERAVFGMEQSCREHQDAEYGFSVHCKWNFSIKWGQI